MEHRQSNQTVIPFHAPNFSKTTDLIKFYEKAIYILENIEKDVERLEICKKKLEELNETISKNE